MIRLELQDHHEQLPCARTVRRHLSKAQVADRSGRPTVGWHV